MNFYCRWILVLFLMGFDFVRGQSKPNILWITIEDTSPQFIGCYGNKDASTPVIDRLAEEGVRFTNAFSTGTVCSPSRSTIITGVRTYEMGTGNHRSAYPIPDFIKGFPHYLKEQGYYVANNSKTDYNLANARVFTANTWHESSNTAGWWNRKEDQPFFAVFNFAESHQSRTMSMPFDWYKENVWDHLPKDARIADTAFDLPPFYRDSPEMRKQFARVYNSIKLTDIRIGMLLKKLEEDNLRGNTIIIFYADHGEGIPRGKTNGINLGYRVPFVMWFPEKFKQLSPWGTGGVVSDELITFEDLAPTMISLAGGKVPDYMKGSVLMGKEREEPKKMVMLSADRADNSPDLVRSITDGTYLYSRNFMPFMPEMRFLNYVEIAEITQHMRKDLENDLLNATQRKIFSPRSAEFLFDIENDTWETQNLVNDSNVQTVLKKMRSELDKRILKSRDVHFLPEYEISLVSKSSTPYEYRLDNEKYPLEKIYEAASLSGKRGKTEVEKQMELLGSNNKIIRYWASMGLMSQDRNLIKGNIGQLKEYLQDDYDPVCINIATLLYEQFENDETRNLLISYCKSDNLDLALMAINNLLYVNYKEPFVETIKKVSTLPNRGQLVKNACSDFLHNVGIIEY